MANESVTEEELENEQAPEGSNMYMDMLDENEIEPKKPLISRFFSAILNVLTFGHISRKRDKELIEKMYQKELVKQQKEAKLAEEKAAAEKAAAEKKAAEEKKAKEEAEKAAEKKDDEMVNEAPKAEKADEKPAADKKTETEENSETEVKVME